MSQFGKFSRVSGDSNLLRHKRKSVNQTLAYLQGGLRVALFHLHS